MRSDIEFVDQLVVVPRLCEMCLAHPAVFLWTFTWPDAYICRLCVNQWIPIWLAAEKQRRRHSCRRSSNRDTRLT